MSCSVSIPVKVGQLMCQRSPFMRELTTRVVSCSLAPAPPVMKKKAAAAEGDAAQQQLYQIVCEDSILFPEGGGQPCDYGTLNDTIAVKSVQRQGDTCVIFANAALEEGASVKMAVDWARRKDHMEHHTGQHLLTAIVERELKLPTESWALSYPTCYLQLPTATIPQEDVDRVESIVNDYIAKGVAVDLREFSSKAEIPEARSRSIPDDVKGPIRIIDINEDIDSCTCCGTHVTNLHQLQALKILHQETKGNTCKLHFIVGNRVLEQFGQLYFREKALIKEMGCQAEDLLARATRRGKELGDATKANKKLLAEISLLTLPTHVENAKKCAENKEVHAVYREDADGDFFTPIAAACKPIAVNLFFWGTSASDGAFAIYGGTDEEVKRLGALVCAASDGKGGGKGDYRGKCDAKKLKKYVEKELKAAWATTPTAV